MIQSALAMVPPIENPFGLRWYQQDAVTAIQRELAERRSTLAVLATGLGKTQIFSAVAGQWDGPVLVLAHREELVQQARARIEQLLEEPVDVEQAGQRSDRRTRIVVGSVQTVMQQRRLDAMGPYRFSLVIADEAHHYVAKRFRQPLDFFHAKVLGVTATPDRGDEKAMGKIFESVAYVMDIVDGIKQGYLAPLRGVRVELADVKLDGIKKTAGDLAVGELDEAMLEAVEGVVQQSLELSDGRRGIAFFPGVKSAALACERFNVLRPGSACFISGETDPDERRAVIRAYRNGAYQFLCNCQIATEGFDAPEASVIIVARPTLSRALYAQMVGRGTRVLPGLVEATEGKDAAPARRALVAGSRKPNCLVLDFVGCSHKHELMTPADLLGGDYTDEEVAEAKKAAAKDRGTDPSALLEAARAMLKAQAARVKATVTATVTSFDPFDVMGLQYSPTDRYAKRFELTPASAEMKKRLEDKGVQPADLRDLSTRAAARLLSEMTARRKRGLATYKQLRQLQRFGVTDTNVSFAGASRGLDCIARSLGWSEHRGMPYVTGRVDAAELRAAIRGGAPS